MHSIAILSAIFAASAVATPFNNKHAAFHKRQPAEVTDWVYDVAYTTIMHTVTAGEEAAVETPHKYKEVEPAGQPHEHDHSSAKTVTYSAPATTSAAESESVYTPSSTYVAPKSTSSASAAYSASSPPSSPVTSGSYEDVIVSNHNSLRDNFKAGPLAWNDTLAGYAKYQAEAANCNMAHNLNGPNGESLAIGQNLAMGTDTDAINGIWTNVAGQVGMWYGPGEIQAYQNVSSNFASPPSASSMSTGAVDGTEFLHFSQLVWKGTEQVGCYTVPDCPNTESLTFCNYYPAGNIADENDSNQYQSYLQNVGSPISRAKDVNSY